MVYRKFMFAVVAVVCSVFNFITCPTVPVNGGNTQPQADTTGRVPFGGPGGGGGPGFYGPGEGFGGPGGGGVGGPGFGGPGGGGFGGPGFGGPGGGGFGGPGGGFGGPGRPPINRPGRGCPLCDSSVYSYCGKKLIHDACCCNDPYEAPLPFQCRYADCSFLHANSCQEHQLITSCCCNNVYKKK